MTQRELESKIQEAQDAYYNGEPIMEDHEFDKLWDELKRNYPSSVFLQNVGVDNTDGFEKAQHVMLMGSQNKANSAAEMNKFFDPNKEYVVDFKFDGCLSFDTVLDTDQGPLKIGDIVENKIQCNVKALDLNTGKQIFTPIKNWFINKNNFEWFLVKTKSGKSIIATSNHKFYLPELGCFRQLSLLKKGDMLELS